MLVPVVPPNSEGAVVVPPAEGGGFVVFPKMLPPLPNGLGVGVDGFAPNKPPEVVPEAGLFKVVPPNRLPPVAGVVAVVPDVLEVAPKSEPAGLLLKMFAGAVVVVPVPVVPVPVVPVPVPGVAPAAGFVWPKSPEPPPKMLGLVFPPPPVPR